MMREFLQGCHDLEVRSAQIYQVLKQTMRLGEETRAVFSGLARAEGIHGESLLEVLNRAPVSGGSLCELAQPGLLVGRTEELLRVLADTQLSDFEALRLTKDLEMRCWKFHLQNSLVVQQEGLKNLFFVLAKEEKSHITFLAEHFLKLTAGEKGSRFNAGR